MRTAAIRLGYNHYSPGSDTKHANHQELGARGAASGAVGDWDAAEESGVDAGSQ